MRLHRNLCALSDPVLVIGLCVRSILNQVHINPAPLCIELPPYLKFLPVFRIAVSTHHFIPDIKIQAIIAMSSAMVIIVIRSGILNLDELQTLYIESQVYNYSVTDHKRNKTNEGALF